MSMNFSEFKRMLNSDPGSQDPEFLAARRSDPQFALASEASDAFEKRLKRASHLAVDPGLAERLKALPENAGEARPSLPYRFRYALAATVILGFSVALLMPQLQQAPEPVEGYVARHFGLDGHELMQRAGVPQVEELAAILASFDLRMDPQMASQVQFVKYCPTPEGMGVHLVLDSPKGLVTVIFMPGLEVPEGQQFAFNDMAAQLINLPGRNTSAAIIGQPGQLDPALGLAIERNVASLSGDA